jgi:glycosyltransferase involved in cell wall biosynthesis
LPNVTWHELPSEFLRLPLWSLRLFARLIQAPFFPRSHPAFRIADELHCDAYHANNWDALPFGAVAAKHNDSKLVLDIHESYDAWYWGWIAPITKYIFRKYSKQIDSSTTPGEGYAEKHREFGLDPIIVLNAPSKINYNKKQKKTEQFRIRLVHHGPAIPARTSDLMIKAIALSDSRYELSLMLTNPENKYVRYLKNLAFRIARGRVSFPPPVPPFDIVHEIAQYDVGFYPLPPKNYNQSIALPNKLFEFMSAGLAICIGPSPSMTEIVREYHCGVVAPSFDPDDIAKVLNNTSAEQWNEMRKASLRAAKVLNAEKEMGKVLEIYRKLFKEPDKAKNDQFGTINV